MAAGHEAVSECGFLHWTNAGAVFRLHRENLVRAMITGRKRARLPESEQG